MVKRFAFIQTFDCKGAQLFFLILETKSLRIAISKTVQRLYTLSQRLCRHSPNYSQSFECQMPHSFEVCAEVEERAS
jgi:hypothetical protein